MGDRLNDTKAVVAMVPYESQSDHYSRTVRKIDNGYVTSHYGCNPNDPEGPTNKEVFSEDHPDKTAMGSHGNPMRRAVEFMTKK